MVLFLPHIVLYVKDQGEKQKKVIEINKTELDNKQKGDELLLSKERQIFKNFWHKSLNKTDELSQKLEFGDLKFIVNSTDQEINISDLKIL